jgi:hypothetical protein
MDGAGWIAVCCQPRIDIAMFIALSRAAQAALAPYHSSFIARRPLRIADA